MAGKVQTNGSLAPEQKRVIVIPAHDEIVARKLRVAAYADQRSSADDRSRPYAQTRLHLSGGDDGPAYQQRA